MKFNLLEVIVAATLFYGCSDDFLNKTKLGTLTSENFFVTETMLFSRLLLLIPI